MHEGMLINKINNTEISKINLFERLYIILSQFNYSILKLNYCIIYFVIYDVFLLNLWICFHYH